MGTYRGMTAIGTNTVNILILDRNFHIFSVWEQALNKQM